MRFALIRTCRRSALDGTIETVLIEEVAGKTKTNQVLLQLVTVVLVGRRRFRLRVEVVDVVARFLFVRGH